MRDKFGDTMGFRLVVYPDYAVIDRVDPKNSSRQAELHVPRWRLEELGAGHDDDSASTMLADLSAFNVAAVAATLAGAPKPWVRLTTVRRT